MTCELYLELGGLGIQLVPRYILIFHKNVSIEKKISQVTFVPRIIDLWPLKHFAAKNCPEIGFSETFLGEYDNLSPTEFCAKS